MAGSKKTPVASPGTARKPDEEKVPPPPSEPTKKPAAPTVGARGGKATLRSENHVKVPNYQRGPKDAPEPTGADVLRFLGLSHTRALTDQEMRSLVKTDDGVLLVADDILRLYRTDYENLGLRDLSPEALEGLYERATFLVARLPALDEAALIALHQKLVALSDLVDSLLRIRRRVQALSPEDPALGQRWASRLTWFDNRYPGRGAGAATPENTPATPPSPPIPSPSGSTDERAAPSPATPASPTARTPK